MWCSRTLQRDGRSVLRFERELSHTRERVWRALTERGGCRLTLEHSFADRFKAARDGAGWHLCLTALDALLDGAEAPAKGSARELPEGCRELNESYQRRFGIRPEEATPVPDS